MKISRRKLLEIASTLPVATAVGCADGLAPGDAEVQDDAAPDPEVDASPEDLDGAIEIEPEDGSVGDDGGDASVDASFDGGERDAGPIDSGAISDARVTDTRPSDTGVAPSSLDFTRLPERTAQFPYAVMAGDATDTSVMFWTKFTGTGPLTLRVLEMNGTTITAVRYNGVVTPGAGGFVRVIVNGLRPNRRHRYAFLMGTPASPTGRSAIGVVKTAFAADTLAPITFGGTSCSHPNARPHPVLQHAGSRTDLDFFIHLGDHIYADAGDNAVTLAEYRDKYELSWPTTGMKALHKSTGTYLTWDDHEVLNNWDPETISAARLTNARNAFFEHRATRRNATSPNRLWRSFRWGRTAEIFILDCRSERRPSTRSTSASRASQYLSRAQMDWLKNGLRTSPCVFKFIMNSVPIVDRAGSDGDNWNGYVSQRNEILNHIANNDLRGVLWLSGDVHFGGVCRVEASGPWSNIWEVVMGPSGSSRDSNPVLNTAQWPVRVLDNIKNYVVIRANPSTRVVDVEFINAAGDRVPGSRWTRTL
ncbi:MAG: alkaline phosphatase D family protein [Myxococcales bacterium]|nr:alkaline phosphatase D family protein [Myxococcales bacterium]